MSSWDRWGSTIGTRQQSVTVFTRGEGGGGREAFYGHLLVDYIN